PKLPVIIATAYGTTDTAIEAVKRGAYDYILKPFDVSSLQTLVDKAVEASRMMHSYVGLQGERFEAGEVLIGNSPPMQEVYKLIGQVAPTDATVLIRGESGTGKELVARAIYTHSNRADKPFLPVNCAAIPDDLLESELFGHERGAFTSAYTRKIGKFEQCDGGTIFLDEIGDMSLKTQAKILRVIQDGEMQRLGGNERIKVDVRIIAATNKNLKHLIAQGRFREDLYYRLNVVTIRIPPLRERKEDIPLLARYFLEKDAKQMGKPIMSISEEAMEKLVAHDWPGNVRELENVIKRAVVISREPIITAEDVIIEPIPIKRSLSDEETDALLDEVFERAIDLEGEESLMGWLEREMIVRALRRTGGNQSKAAKLLGMNRNTLRSKMKSYGISISFAPALPDDSVR
ncbi:TPA: sigma-54-dependent Fis family transcriptional regulator, partial [Candidatus Poribacteria bacterium]|nr:sigma-54-dependent Fis family transcriptional regulator [Candidatus Poribacteria bacterium]HEX28923.1 sigma-54-dependent Fis family transcriptional regulator [Candidatus Poribacteria bacterium]